jgi:hypothetical protein
MEQDYTKRELDSKFSEVTQHLSDQDKKLDRILTQTTEHNHRMSKIERVLLVVGTVVIVLLITNGSRFVDFASTIFK